MASVVDHYVWAPICCFLPLFGLFALNFISVELENPFGIDPNDLPMVEFQIEMNSCLLMLLHPQADHIATMSPTAEHDYQVLVAGANAEAIQRVNSPVKHIIVDELGPMTNCSNPHRSGCRMDGCVDHKSVGCMADNAFVPSSDEFMPAIDVSKALCGIEEALAACETVPEEKLQDATRPLVACGASPEADSERWTFVKPSARHRIATLPLGHSPFASPSASTSASTPLWPLTSPSASQESPGNVRHKDIHDLLAVMDDFRNIMRLWTWTLQEQVKELSEDLNTMNQLGQPSNVNNCGDNRDKVNVSRVASPPPIVAGLEAACGHGIVQAGCSRRSQDFLKEYHRRAATAQPLATEEETLSL